MCYNRWCGYRRYYSICALYVFGGKMKIYQAGPLFSLAEQNFHRELKKALEQYGHEVIWPFELFGPEEVKSWGENAPHRIMLEDSQALSSCDIVVALLDGPQVDDGTAWEIGFAYAKGIPVIGLRTDFRNCGDNGYSMVNSMIHGSCCIVEKVSTLIDVIENGLYK